MAIFNRNPVRGYDLLKQEALKARQPFDRDVLLNIAFYLNQQYVEWQTDSVGGQGSLRTIARGKGEKRTPRPVANKIMHFVTKQWASALKDDPMPDVLPASEDPDDTSYASVGGAYLKWLNDAEVADLEGELGDASLWALAGGEGFLKWTYDSDQKRPDICSCSPLDISYDPYAKRWRSVRYLVHEQYMDVKAIKEVYGKDVQPTAISKADAQKAMLLRDMGIAPVLEGAVVNELWIKPKCMSDYPKGLFVVWTGNTVLVEPVDFPYDHGQLPFTQIGAINRPGSPHTTCTVTYLRSPQMELNKYHAQRISVREKFANPKWWIPTEIELEEDPDDSVAQILRGSASQGYKPELIQPTVFPENSDGEWIKAEMEDVAGQHEVSNAQVPGRVEAAQAISLLVEEDNNHLTMLRKSIKKALAQGGWQCLQLARQYNDEEIVIQTYSREGVPEVHKFMTEKFLPGMRVRVTLGTGLADSRAARQQQATELWREGVIRDPETMAELLDLPTASLNPNRAFDVTLSRNENLTMMGNGADGTPGVAITPNSYDAHDIHLREHNNYRKTQEYLHADPEVKKKFEFHCDTHEELWLQELQKEATRAAIAQGAQPGSAAGKPEATASDQPAAGGEQGQQPQEESQPNGQ